MGSIPRVYLREMCFTEIEIDLAVINITVESDNLNATDFTIHIGCLAAIVIAGKATIAGDLSSN